MMTPTQITVSEAEWEIMRVVWANTAVTSRVVIDILENKMNWKESTIKTLLRRLVEKEALTTQKEGRKYIYTAKINEDESVKNFSEEILTRICDKNNGKVIKNLIEDAKLSQADIADLEELLKEKAEFAPEEVECQCEPGQCDCHLIDYGGK